MKLYIYWFALFLCGISPCKQSYAQGSWKWAVGSHVSPGGQMEGFGQPTVITDKSGNIFLSGFNEADSAQLGPFTVYSPGDSVQQLIIAKIDSQGNYQWVISSLYTYANPISMVTDDSGNLYALMIYSGDGYIAGYPVYNTASYDMLLMKFSPSGTLLKTISGPFPVYARGTGLGVDSLGNMYVSGNFTLTQVFGSDSLFCSGFESIAIVKYDSSGAVKWAECINGDTEVSTGDYGGLIRSMVVSKNGDLTIAGGSASHYMQIVNPYIGDTVLPNNRDFLLRLNANGKLVWVTSMPLHEFEISHVLSFDVDDSENVYLTGGYDSMAVFKYSNTGALLWTKYAAGYSNSIGEEITVDQCHNVWVCGPVLGYNISFDGTILDVPTMAYNPLFVAEYDGDGNYINGMVLYSGGDYVHGLNGIAVDGQNNLYIGGEYNRFSVFGIDTFNTGVTTLYLAKYHYNNSCWETSVPAIKPGNNFNLFPNPATSVITVQSLNEPISTINITNMLGQAVYSWQFAVSSTQTDVDVSYLPHGIYFVKVNNEVRKVLKQ